MMSDQQPPVQPQQPMLQITVPPPKAAVPWDDLAVVAAGRLSLVGFFLLPFMSTQGFPYVSATAEQIASTGGQALWPMRLASTGYNFLWPIVGAAGLAIVVAGTSAAARPQHGVWWRLLTCFVITLAGVVSLLAGLWVMSIPTLSYQAVQPGAGFWACVIANAGLLIGAFAVNFGG
jgi:hypothetical protein